MNTKGDKGNKLIRHWTKNLVGTRNGFFINLTITLLSGFLYSFKVIPFPFMLLIFGVVSPVIFTVCLYTMIFDSHGLIDIESFPKAFLSRSGNRLMMLFDILLIIGFALLINANVINNLLFRFLQTVFFPATLLVLLRIIYLGEENIHFRDGSGDDIYQ